MLIMVKKAMAKIIRDVSIAILAITTTICVATVSKNVVSASNNLNNAINDVRNGATSQIGDIRNDVKEVLNTNIENLRQDANVQIEGVRNDLKEVLNTNIENLRQDVNVYASNLCDAGITNLNEVIKYLITPQPAVIVEPIDTNPDNSVDSSEINSNLTLDNSSFEKPKNVILPEQQINYTINGQAPIENLAFNLLNPAVNNISNEITEQINNIINDENNLTRQELFTIANNNLNYLVAEVSKIITDENNPARQELLEILTDEKINNLVDHTQLTLNNCDALVDNINQIFTNNPKKIQFAFKVIQKFKPKKPSNSKTAVSNQNSNVNNSHNIEEISIDNNYDSQLHLSNDESKLLNVHDNNNTSDLNSNEGELSNIDDNNIESDSNSDEGEPSNTNNNGLGNSLDSNKNESIASKPKGSMLNPFNWFRK